jgi:hypothetical protein
MVSSSVYASPAFGVCFSAAVSCSASASVKSSRRRNVNEEGLMLGWSTRSS